MVMHARKLPRLNDGYYDRHDYHEEKNDRFQARNSNYDRIPHDRRNRDEYSAVNDRQNSPRYSHKPPYTDRMRSDKDRHKYNREKERYTREDHRFNPLDKHNINSVNNSSRNDIVDYKFMDTNSDNCADSNEANDKGCTRALDELKTTSCSEKSNSSQTKDPRAVEAQKIALRVCGDWSEHVSSSGKKYFYNCKTEVSQWVKPKEWKAADEQVKQANVRITSSSSTTLSTTHTNTDASNYNGSSHDTSLDSPSRSRNKNNKSNNDSHDYEDNSQVETLKIDRIDGNSSTNLTSALSNRNSSNFLQNDKLKDSKDNNGSDSHHKTDHHSSSSVASCTPSPSSHGTASPTVYGKNSRPAGKDKQLQLTNGTNEGSGDDMDISPEGSPKPVLESNCTLQTTCNKQIVRNREEIGSTQRSNAPQTNNTEQNMIWGKALQTLQTLQEVLERSRGSSSQQIGNSGRNVESPISAASQSPRVIPLSAQTASIMERVSEDITSDDKSPSMSEASVGQHSMLSLAADSNSSSAANTTLSPSFINYYDPSMISHISGWPAEQIELRAHMTYKDGIIICGHHCGQVSTELKRDRSQVRIAEVQSTLIEHRIMFLKQQISELETQDRNFTSGQGQT